MNLIALLSQPFVPPALLAALLVAVICGLIGPFVAARDMAFAVHGAAELSFTGAAAGLLLAADPLDGALVGSVVVAIAFATLAGRPREQNSSIGVVLAAGLALGFLLLSFYKGYASEALNILVGAIFYVGPGDLVLLAVVAAVILVVVVIIYRPLLFSSVDPDVAEARGVRTRLVGLVFLLMLTLTVTEASQVVGTLLVLSLAITPAAAARHLTASPIRVSVLAVVFAVVAAEGGLIVDLVFPTFRASVFIAAASFLIYVVTRTVRVLRPVA